MFLKKPRASTDQRVRSLLQKAARRGYTEIVELALTWLDRSGDKTWLRSRSIVITFEECWPLAASLHIDPSISSKQIALQRVTKSSKQKDAAGLGALAYAYHEDDQSMIDCVPERRVLKIISEALNRPKDFFEWVRGQSTSQCAADTIRSAQQYLAAATWPWDKACILAGALLATTENFVEIDCGCAPSEEFPYWSALDKHTPEGKAALKEVANTLKSTYRCLIWAGFYFESARVNKLLPSLWWEAEKKWRLRQAGLTLEAAEELWLRARPLLSQRLSEEAASLKRLVETFPSGSHMPAQSTLL